MSAVAGNPVRHRPTELERTAVTGHDLLQQLLNGPNVHTVAVLVGQRHPVGRRDVLVHQQALGDGGKFSDVARQRVK